MYQLCVSIWDYNKGKRMNFNYPRYFLLKFGKHFHLLIIQQLRVWVTYYAWIIHFSCLIAIFPSSWAISKFSYLSTKFCMLSWDSMTQLIGRWEEEKLRTKKSLFAYINHFLRVLGGQNCIYSIYSKIGVKEGVMLCLSAEISLPTHS